MNGGHYHQQMCVVQWNKFGYKMDRKDIHFKAPRLSPLACADMCLVGKGGEMGGYVIESDCEEEESMVCRLAFLLVSPSFFLIFFR